MTMGEILAGAVVIGYALVITFFGVAGVALFGYLLWKTITTLWAIAMGECDCPMKTYEEIVDEMFSEYPERDGPY